MSTCNSEVDSEYEIYQEDYNIEKYINNELYNKNYLTNSTHIDSKNINSEEDISTQEGIITEECNLQEGENSQKNNIQKSISQESINSIFHVSEENISFITGGSSQSISQSISQDISQNIIQIKENENEKKIYKSNNILTKEEEIIEVDYEPIFTLSKSKYIENNKKIQTIKLMLNALLSKHFTFNEIITIHSIYNFNKHCLLTRNKCSKEFVLTLVLLHFFHIKINNYVKVGLFYNIPWDVNSKKVINILEEIKEMFQFGNFIEKYQIDNSLMTGKNKKYICYSYALVFYIKNLVLLKDNFDNFLNYCESELKTTITVEEINKFKYLFIKDKNILFCENPKLKIMILWLNNLVKRILFFNMFTEINYNKTNTKLQDYILNNQKNIHFLIQSILNTILYLVYIMNTDVVLIKEKFDYIKIKKFLSYEYHDTYIFNLIDNKVFYLLCKYIISKKIKTGISLKKFTRTLYKYMI